MQPEDYLRQYTAPFQPAETLPHPLQDEAALMLARGYYYPPYLKLETYLDVLNRSELQHVVQGILAADGTKQRLTRRDVIEHLETVQRLKGEREQQRLEISRLNAELTGYAEKATQQVMALEQLQATVAQLAADNAALRKTVAEICASTSWKATAPLRRLMQAIRALV